MNISGILPRTNALACLDGFFKSETHGRFADNKGMKISVPYSLFPIFRLA
ncbi:hypothetical protein [Moorena sp. SIO3I6]|nr:hypothetical protein [Moorena sp. SIO3I6]NEP23136.1 hypothetical protein [Moorena sp. SIO3I6]